MSFLAKMKPRVYAPRTELWSKAVDRVKLIVNGLDWPHVGFPSRDEMDAPADSNTEFVRECRTANPRLPIIAVSSHKGGNAALMGAGASAVCGKMESHRIEEVIKAVSQSVNQ